VSAFTRSLAKTGHRRHKKNTKLNLLFTLRHSVRSTPLIRTFSTLKTMFLILSPLKSLNVAVQNNALSVDSEESDLHGDRGIVHPQSTIYAIAWTAAHLFCKSFPSQPPNGGSSGPEKAVHD
jgi:hypothetical protein